MASPYPAILREPTADDFWRARLRIWAAAIRDRKSPHRDAPPDAILAAGMLCRVLDDMDVLGPTRAEKCGLKKTCGQLLEKLRMVQVRPPAVTQPVA
jgi:hypothetical protein